MAPLTGIENEGQRHDGEDMPQDHQGTFVVPTGSVSMLNVSASIGGGLVGSTSDTKALLDGFGTAYEESWHEPIHYLDKRVSVIADGLNRVAEASTHQSGSSGELGAANKLEILSLITATALNTSKTGISDAQTSAITANTSKTGITSGQASAITANTAKTGITSGQATVITNLGTGITCSSFRSSMITITKDRENNLVISDGTHRWTIAAD